ncbi:MAG: hypothetical protein AB7I27_14990 [Bacteriovoracaceae bacterium]
MNFIRVFFLTIFILITLLLGLVYSIDPYDKYGINLFGFNTKAVAMARENKFNMVEHSKKEYQAFVIGSSAAHRLHTTDVEQFIHLKTFNYSLQHTMPEDYLAIVRHILERYHPKMILLQMDFYTLNKNFLADTRFFTSPLYPYFNNKNSPRPERSFIDFDYFTLKAISDSFKVIWVNNFGKARHLYLEDGNYQAEKAYHGPIKINQFQYTNYEFDQNRINYLKEIKRLCDERNIKLVVWTTPYSFNHLEKIEQESGLGKKHLEFKQVLAQIFGTIYDFSTPEIREFSNDKYFRDSTHPTRELFKLMLSKIFHPEESTFPPLLGAKLNH